MILQKGKEVAWLPVLDKDNGTSNEYRQSSFATSSAKDGIEAKLSDEERRSALNFLSADKFQVAFIILICDV